LQRLKQHFGDLVRAWEALPLELAQVEGLGPQTTATIDRHRPQIQPLEFLQRHEQANPQFCTPADPEYPPLLREIPNYPVVLYYRGQPQVWEQYAHNPAIAIVGTRNPSEYGQRWTRRCTQALTQQGFTIVSGLAAGIDAEAHRTCLGLGGFTIAVLGTGVDVVYPLRNQKIYEQILATGLVVSEYPAGTQPDRTHFPQRNRIIAGLTQATLVTEAPKPSGALITAHLANDFGRDVYIVPGSLDNPKSAGCLNLLSQGAQAILGEQDLLEQLGSLPSGNPAPPITEPPPDLAPELAQVLEVLSLEPLPFDLIVQASQLSTQVVSSALLQLELMALVTQIPGLRYQRC
jgi:DNA processing protein